MNIHSSKGKLKGANVTDIAFKEELEKAKAKNFYMQNDLTQAVPVKNIRAALDQASGVDVLLAEQNARKGYNERIVNLDPRYTALIPLDGFIVRMMVKEAVKTNSGLILPSMNKARGKTYNGFDDDPVTDVYNFAQKAIIVSAPSYETVLVPGSIIHIAPVMPIVVNREIVGYELQYAHPDYQGSAVPKSVGDPDFGYAIIPRNRIRVIISLGQSNADNVLDAG